jgi:2-dehydropantoate 2-reductase
MRIVVFGAGGVGGYFGERLAAAGADVKLIARGRHLEAIRHAGLTVRTPEGETTRQIPATHDPAEIGPVDVVLFCGKSYDTDRAAAALPPLVHDRTAVVSLQNGVDNEERIAAAVGWPHVVGGAAYIFAAVESPGVVRASGPRSLVFGEWGGGPPSERLSALAELFRAAGADARISEDVRVAIWEKYVLLVAFSGLSAATRLPLGEIRDAPAAWELLRGLANEAWQVGRAAGVPLGDDVVDRAVDTLGRQEAGAFASLYHDLVAGHPMELEALQGTLLRLGREHGIETPIGRAVYAVLEPWARRNAQ